METAAIIALIGAVVPRLLDIAERSARGEALTEADLDLLNAHREAAVGRLNRVADEALKRASGAGQA